MAITTLKSSRDFFRIWFFWKKQAIFIFCLIVVSICFYSFTSTPMYKSSAKILLLPKTNDAVVVTAGNDSRQYAIQPVSNADINTEIQLIKSDEVINRTIASLQQNVSNSNSAPQKKSIFHFLDFLKFKKQPISDFEKKARVLYSELTVEPVLSSNIISVSLKSPYKHQVAKLLDQLIKNYVRYHNTTFNSNKSHGFYDEQKEYYRKKFMDASKELAAFSTQNNIINMKSQIQANINLLSAFQTDLQNLEIQISENKGKVKMLKAGLNARGDKIIISKEMRSLPIIVELARGLVPLLIRRTEISKTFTHQSREYKQIDEQIAMLRKEIKQESINASRTDELETKALDIKRKALVKRIEYLNDQSNDLERKKEKLEILRLQVDIAKKNYLKYASKTEDSRLYAERNASNLANVVISEPASIPDRPVSPKKLLAFEVSIFLGLFAAFILPFILETFDHKLKTTDDVESVLSLPVVCTYSEV